MGDAIQSVYHHCLEWKVFRQHDEKLVLNSIPRPTTEEQCAAYCGYRFINSNIVDDEGMIQQQQYNKRKYGDVLVKVDPCTCSVIDNEKCCDDSCLNRNECRACDPDCGPACKNNPWVSGFAAGTKTYLKFDKGKGFGLYANDIIYKNEWIGEYTGRIVPSDRKMTSEQESYSFNIANLKQKLDSFSEGSSVRLINHSCDPNCESWVYLHEGSCKVVYMARKQIELDEELTVNYRWEYENESQAMQCLCKSNPEPHFIAIKMKTKDKCSESSGSCFSGLSDEYDATTTTTVGIDKTTASDSYICFPMLYDFALEVMENENGYPMGPLERPENFTENHLFKPFSRVFALVSHQGAARIVSGRTIRCSLSNDSSAVIYTVACPYFIKFDVVQWLCHHFHEDALFMLHHLLTEEDVRHMTKHESNPAGNFLETYIKKFQCGGLPKTELWPSCIPTPFVIGAPTYRLVLQQKNKNTTGLSSDLTTATITCPTNTTGNGDYYYNPREQKDINSTLAMCQQETCLHRMLDMSCEMVATFAIARLPRNQTNVNYRMLYRTIRQDLETFYFETLPKHRRFLSFSHYKLAINVLVEGSLGWNWCSLCNLSNTFTSEMELRRHFDGTHAICASSYPCYTTNSPIACTLPSEFRRHAQDCTPRLFAGLLYGIPEYIMDAYADFVRSKGHGNQVTYYLMQPGMPKIKGQNVKTGQNKGEPIQMNLATRAPLKADMSPLPVKIRIPDAYILQKNWPSHPVVITPCRASGEICRSTTTQSGSTNICTQPTSSLIVASNGEDAEVNSITSYTHRHRRSRISLSRKRKRHNTDSVLSLQ